MSRERDEGRDAGPVVTAADVLAAFDTAERDTLTAHDVATRVGCPPETVLQRLHELHDSGLVERRDAAEETSRWRRTDAVNPDDPIFDDAPVFASGDGDLSERVDQVVYGDDP